MPSVWRRRSGIIKTRPRGTYASYYPDPILDGGADAPLSNRRRWKWRLGLALIVALGLVAIALSR